MYLQEMWCIWTPATVRPLDPGSYTTARALLENRVCSRSLISLKWSPSSSTTSLKHGFLCCLTQVRMRVVGVGCGWTRMEPRCLRANQVNLFMPLVSSWTDRIKLRCQHLSDTWELFFSAFSDKAAVQTKYEWNSANSLKRGEKTNFFFSFSSGYFYFI